MKDLFKILVIPFLSITLATGQIIDVSDLYQKNNYFFPNFEKVDKHVYLPHYRISSLIEDHDGYLWIGTKDGGLYRFDGYEFNAFELDPSDPFSLSSNDVFFVFEDSRDMLWVGTDNGLNYYHPSLRHFLKVKLVTSYDSIVAPRNISCITEANNGNILIGTNIGIFEISNIQDSNFKVQQSSVLNHDSIVTNINHILLQPEDSLIAGMIVKDIKYDSDGLLWILSEFELGYINYNDCLTNYNQKHDDNKVNGNYKTVVKVDDGSSLFVDDEGLIWVNNNSKLFRVSKTVASFEIDSIAYNSNAGFIDNFSNNDATGSSLWLGHYSNNLMMFDEETETFYSLTFETNDLNNIRDNGVSCFLRTRSNAIFIGTAWGGLYKFNPNSVLSNFHPKLQEIHQNQTDNLRYVYEDSKGYIWMIAEDIYRCNKNTGEILSTYTDEFFNHEWSYTNILLEDNEGRFWVGMESRGLAYIDIQNDSAQNDPTKWVSKQRKVIKDKTITALYESADSMIWAGTIYRDLDSAKIYTELFKINHSGDILGSYPITQCLLRNGNETDQFINQIYIDNNNIVWLATGYGLVKFSEAEAEIEIFTDTEPDELTLGKSKVLTICPDPYKPDSILWLGTTNKGLCRFDIINDIRKRIHPQRPPSNHIASILADDIGNLWLGTDRGITKIVIDTSGGDISKIYNFHTSDGLITNDFTSYYGPNAVKTKNGQLIFTGPRGFQIIKPENIKDDSNIPPLHITDFTVNHQPANYGQAGSPLNKPISITDYIQLPYNSNTLGFELTALDFKSTNQLSYAFKLENYDNDWINNGNKRTVQYTKLPPGDYKLMVKIATRDSDWSDSTFGVQIKIEKPWWLSYYSYFFYALLLIVFIWLIDRIQVSRYNMKANIKLNQVEANKLRELDIMKSKFFANISHEFKTPLTLIMNPVEEMLTKQDETTSRNSLLMIKRNAKRLQKYITEILELSKLDANRLKLSIREIDIVDYMKYMVASFESHARQKDISLKLKSTTDEAICYLDPDKINTIITNLLTNAIRFTPKGGKVELSISGCLCNQHDHCTQKKGCLIISVKDNGIGIREENIPFIFDRYYRVKKDNNDGETGTGLGLALVKELVNLHHGTINVLSKENSFTDFQLNFPMGRYHIKPNELVVSTRYEITEDFDVQQISSDEVNENDTNESQELNLKIILVIEDNKDMRTLISAGLKRDYQVIVARDGDEGIQMAIETSPSLILCDVMMPKKDGYEVAKILKSNEITSHIPIIFITAKAQLEDKLTGLETGADDYLIKPFYAKELKARVANLLEQRDKLREKFSKLNILKLDNLPDSSIDQVFLEKVITSIETNMSDENFGVQVLIDELNISRTQLHRKLKALVNQSTNELIQSIRLQKASEMLKNKVGSVSEICYLVGFTSPPYFTRLFKQHFGHNPTEHTRL